MQQPAPVFPVTPSFPSTSITTEQIQKYLDENKKLILAILDNQNLGKLAECAQYQAQLQKNLMYLAAIADAQPQTPSPAMPLQVTPHPAMTMQQGGLYMPHHQAAAVAQQPGIFSQQALLSTSHPMQDPHHQLPRPLHPQSAQGLVAMWPVGATNGMNPMHNSANLGGAKSSFPNVYPGNKQDKPEGGAKAKPDGQDGDKAK